MTRFLDKFPDDVIMVALGDEVIYTPLGGISNPITAKVNKGNQNTFAHDSYVPEKQITVDALKTDVPAIGKGDQFIFDGSTLTVDVVQNDDGNIVTVVVH
ncbi:MAG: hypothetical protein WC856_13665 [Methylococcaceae bacterium]|jgi:hypothetical protein